MVRTFVGETPTLTTCGPILVCRTGPPCWSNLYSARDTPVPTDHSNNYLRKQSSPYIRTVQHTVLFVLGLNISAPYLGLKRPPPLPK